MIQCPLSSAPSSGTSAIPSASRSVLAPSTSRPGGQAFAGAGIYAICTGEGNAALPSGSLFQIHFPYQEGRQIERPEDALDPAVCDVALANRVLPLAMLLEAELAGLLATEFPEPAWAVPGIRPVESGCGDS